MLWFDEKSISTQHTPFSLLDDDEDDLNHSMSSGFFPWKKKRVSLSHLLEFTPGLGWRIEAAAASAPAWRSGNLIRKPHTVEKRLPHQEPSQSMWLGKFISRTQIIIDLLNCEILYWLNFETEIHPNIYFKNSKTFILL